MGGGIIIISRVKGKQSRGVGWVKGHTFLPAVCRSTCGFFLPTVNSPQMLKLLIKGPETSETQHRTQFDHDTNVGMVTFGLGGHLEAKIVSKKFA